MTMNKDRDLASAGFDPPVSLVNAVAISSGVKKSDKFIKVFAVAYAENELTKSKRAAPAKEGVRIGIPIQSQYSWAFPPSASEASRHWGFRFSKVGKKTKTMSGIWKKVYSTLNPVFPYSQVESARNE